MPLRGSGCRNLALPGVYEQALPPLLTTTEKIRNDHSPQWGIITVARWGKITVAGQYVNHLTYADRRTGGGSGRQIPCPAVEAQPNTPSARLRGKARSDPETDAPRFAPERPRPDLGSFEKGQNSGGSHPSCPRVESLTRTPTHARGRWRAGSYAFACARGTYEIVCVDRGQRSATRECSNMDALPNNDAASPTAMPLTYEQIRQIVETPFWLLSRSDSAPPNHRDPCRTGFFQIQLLGTMRWTTISGTETRSWLPESWRS